MPLFDNYKASLKNTGATFFQCIGNHDFDRQYQGLHNMELASPVYGEMVYESHFGPTDYSFNIGKAHIVTMKNINYVGGKSYLTSLTGQQLDWLKKDLSYLPEGSLVILNMHAPSWNRISPDGNIRNAAQLKEVLKNYNVHVFSGHTHSSRTMKFLLCCMNTTSVRPVAAGGRAGSISVVRPTDIWWWMLTEMI